MMDDFSTRSSLEHAPPLEDSTSMLLLSEIRDSLQTLRDEIAASIPPNRLTHAETRDLLESLPRLTRHDLVQHKQEDSLCPICLNLFKVILEEEQIATAMDSPAYPIEDLGVTMLSQTWQCGHIFCRRDISKWIQEAHDSCPLCRRLLVQRSSESNTGAEPINIPDLEISVTQLEGRIFQHLDILRTHVQGMQISLSSLDTHPPTGNDDIVDRNEFSGMYS